MPAELPENEYERLIELSEFDLDYSSLQESLDGLAQLAARIAGTEVSLVNLIDSYTQWSVASHGLEIKQMPREESVCQYTILRDAPLEIKDLRLDSRIEQEFSLADGSRLEYYFGVPLRTSKGSNLGALCVLATGQHQLTPEVKDLLQMVADQVVRRLQSLRQIQLLQQQVKVINRSQQKVSHDIRGPIAGIIGIADMLKQELQQGRVKESLELAEMIEQSGESLLELADSIMNESEQPTMPDENSFNCKDLARKLGQLYQPQAECKGIQLNFKAAAGESDVRFSRSRLLQIVGNLITNSIKFTPKDGEVKVELSVEQTSVHEPNRLRVVVADNGTGMSEQKVQEIVANCAQSEQGTRGENGYGFGLPLVYHLVEKAQGQIELRSEAGKGTRFTVQLPV